MKKLRHSWLFAALTIMLGVAVLSSTLAAPALRVVLSSPMAVLEQKNSKRSANAAPGINSPFDTVPPLDTAVPSPGPVQLFEVTDLSPQTGSWWSDTVVDVFTITQKGNEVRNPIYDAVGVVDAAHGQGHPGYSMAGGGKVYDVFEPSTRLVHPGAEGTYEFIVQNKHSLPIDWRLRIMEENDEDNPLPMLYRLRSGTDNYLVGGDNATPLDLTDDTWVPIPATGIAYPLDGISMKSLNAGLSEPNFTLEWKWDIGADDGSDDVRDTSIGENVTDAEANKDESLMPYYRLHFNLYAEGEPDETFTIIWNYKDPLTGDIIEHDRWVINEKDLGKTIDELMDIYGLTIPTPLEFPGHVFKGWRDKDGAALNTDYVVTVDKLVAGVDGSELHALGEYDAGESFTIIWYYTEPGTGKLVEWDRWDIKEEDLGKTIRELMDIYGYAGMPPPPEFPGYRFLGWRDKDGVEITDDYVVTKDKLIAGAGGLEMHLEILGKYNATGSIVDPPWKKPTNLLPFLALIPIAGLLALIPSGSVWWLPLIPAALLIPFLPGWIGKLIKPDPVPSDTDKGYVKPPNTGDTLNLAPVYVLLAVSTGMAIIFGKKRKKDEQDV